MPGIAGFIHSQKDNESIDYLPRMLQHMVRNAEMRVERFQTAQVSLAAVSLAVDGSRLAARHGITLAAGGHVVDHALADHALEDQGDLARQGGGEARETGSLADLLLEVYLQHGVEGLYGLNGHYLAAIWDEHTQKLIVVQDRTGYASNLYYWQTAGELWFASEIKAIAWHPRLRQTVDEVGVADLFCNHNPLADRTLFTDIKALSGAGLLVYQDGRLQVGKYWEPVYFSYGSPLRREVDYQEELVFHLRNAIRRRVAPKSCLLVTGGLDSRAIAGFYREIAPDVALEMLTIGRETGLDCRIGKQVAQAVGANHQRLALDDGYLNDYAALSAWRAEGKMPAYASWIFAAEPALAAQKMRYAITGLFGNLISGRHFPPGMAAFGGVEDFEQHVRGINQVGLRNLRLLMRPELYQRAAQASQDTLLKVFQNAKAEDPLNCFDHVIIASLMSRSACGADALGDAVTVYDPFVDRDLLDFSLSGIPPKVRADPEFYLGLIARYLPEMARLTQGRTGFPVTVDLWLSQHPSFHKANYLRQRLFKRLFPMVFSDEAQGSIPYNEALRKDSAELAQSVLTSAEYLDDLFDMGAVRKMLDDQRNGQGRHLYAPLTMMMTIALFRRQMQALQ